MPSPNAPMHYLQRELYDLVKADSDVFEFLQLGSLDGIWYWDLENPEAEWMSPEFWRLFGVDPATKDHLAAEWQDIIDPDDLALALKNFEQHLADPNHPYDQIVRYRHADGHQVTVRCRGLAIRDETGKPIRMLGAHNDLTALKQREARLRAINDELTAEIERAEAAVKARTAFLATMSHELRTPLNAIMGLLDLIRTDETASDRTQQRADVAHRAAETLLMQLVNALETTRVDAEVTTVQNQWIIPADLRSRWQTQLDGSMARYERVLDTEVTMTDRLPEKLYVDGNKLTQIAGNLIDNAVKFTPQGKIAVTLDYCAGADLPIHLTIADTGIGIAKADRERAFERFVQLPSTLKTQRGGSGLGLSICREFASLMGGTLTIADTPPDGFGLAFELALPDTSATS